MHWRAGFSSIAVEKTELEDEGHDSGRPSCYETNAVAGGQANPAAMLGDKAHFKSIR